MVGLLRWLGVQHRLQAVCHGRRSLFCVTLLDFHQVLFISDCLIRLPEAFLHLLKVVPVSRLLLHHLIGVSSDVVPRRRRDRVVSPHLSADRDRDQVLTLCNLVLCVCVKQI